MASEKTTRVFIRVNTKTSRDKIKANRFCHSLFRKDTLETEGHWLVRQEYNRHVTMKILISEKTRTKI